MRRILILIFLSSLMFGCTTISVHQKTQKVTETTVELGSIGLSNEHIISNSFETIAIPIFENSLKLNVQSVPFAKHSFKAFAKSNEHIKKVALNFSDSLQVKPEYVVLEFVDRIPMIAALNSAENVGVRSYLETKEEARIVTGISIAFSKQQIDVLKKAEEVFLIQSSSKKFDLQLVNTKGTSQTMLLSSGVVFAYQTAGFCWKENTKHKLVIADIVSNSDGCPPNTHRKAQK
ncbi:MAG: hypothetical protein AAF617_01675, partial [Bacteroidota bacterium]